MENGNNIMLVYQGGLANVFEVEPGKPPKRLMQHAYSPCIWFARGMGAAGRIVRTAHCEVAGDCANVDWTPGRGDIFADARVLNNRVKVTIN
jgi:hypothetical protein